MNDINEGKNDNKNDNKNEGSRIFVLKFHTKSERKPRLIIVHAWRVDDGFFQRIQACFIDKEERETLLLDMSMTEFIQKSVYKIAGDKILNSIVLRGDCYVYLLPEGCQ